MLEFQPTRSCTRTSANRPVANTVDGPRPYSCRCKTRLDQIFGYWIVHSDISIFGRTFFLFISTQWTKIKGWRSPFSWGSVCGSAFLLRRKNLTAFQKETSVFMQKWWCPFSRSDLISTCEWVIAIYTRFLFCSMKTRPLFWASGEPRASSAATSVRTSLEKWSSKKSAFYHPLDGNGRATGLLTQHDGKLEILPSVCLWLEELTLILLSLRKHRLRIQLIFRLQVKLIGTDRCFH